MSGRLLLNGTAASALAVHLDREKFPPNVTQVRLTARRERGAAAALGVGDTIELDVELVDRDGFRGKGLVSVGVYEPSGREVVLAERQRVEEVLRMALVVRANWAGRVVLVANDTERGLTARAPLDVAAPAGLSPGDGPAGSSAGSLAVEAGEPRLVPVMEAGGDGAIEEREVPPGGLDAPFPEPAEPTATPVPMVLAEPVARDASRAGNAGVDGPGPAKGVPGPGSDGGDGGAGMMTGDDSGPSVRGFLAFLAVVAVVSVVALAFIARGERSEVGLVKGIGPGGPASFAKQPVASAKPAPPAGDKAPAPAPAGEERPGTSTLRRGPRGKARIRR